MASVGEKTRIPAVWSAALTSTWPEFPYSVAGNIQSKRVAGLSWETQFSEMKDPGLLSQSFRMCLRQPRMMS